MAFVLSGQDIFQSGTDATLAGLSAISGVVTLVQDAEKTYDLGNMTLNISGTLNQDPDFEHIIFNSNNSRAHDIVLSGGGVWNCGVETVVNGFSKFSTGNAVISQRIIPATGGGTYQLLAGSAVIWVTSGGTWNYRGGYIRVNHTIFISSTGKLNMYAGRVQMAGNVKRFGLFSTGSVNFYGGTLDGTQLLVANFPASFSGVEYIDNRGISIESSNNRSPTNIFKGVAFNGSTSDCYVWFNALLELRNSNKGSGLIINGATTNMTASTAGIVLATQDVTVKLADQAGGAINGAVTYIRDTNNGGRYSGYTTFDYTADRVYINSTTPTGSTAEFNVLLGEVVKPVSTVASPFDIRGKTGVAGADLFDVYTLAYGYQALQFPNAKLQSTSTVALSGTMLTDTYVTLSESAALAKMASSFVLDTTANTLTVTANSTLDDVYDALKAYKTQPVQAQLEYPAIGVQPVTASGSLLSTSLSLVLGTGVTLSAGVKLSTLLTTGTVTGLGTLALNSYTTAGTTYVRLAAPNLLAGTRVQILNETTGAEIVNTVLASNGMALLLAYTADATLRLRATRAGLLPLLTSAALTSGGASFLGAQSVDQVYIDNAIDGATVAEFVFDYPQIQIDISDADGTSTVSRLYAWYANEQTTEQGVRVLFGGLVAEDAGNYKIITSVINLKLDNTAATGVQFVGGARLYRDDFAAPVVSQTSGGGSIMLYADKVYVAPVPLSVLTTQESAKLMSLPADALTTSKFLALK